jgi:acetylornithine deacetylase/succinyl-diaminopimelate desuccinylase-like protein
MIVSLRTEAGERAVALLEEMVVIPSITGAEWPLLDFLESRFEARGFEVNGQEVSSGRRNLFIHRDGAQVVFMTHADTVPPFFPPRRANGFLYARGACDAKGSLAAQAVALEELAREGAPVALLVLVGEERGSDGALAANREPRGSRFIVCGEPTGNRFVAGSKGCLRIRAESRGISGHSSVAGSGRSAVPPLLDFLSGIRAEKYPANPVFGETTMNIGVIEAGTAPNVIADRARAEVLFRTGEPVETLLSRIRSETSPEVELEVPYRSDPILFRVPAGGPRGEIVSFACDLPLLPAWGEPILVGPGSILDAHAAEEKVDLSQIGEAVDVYQTLAKGLLAQGDAYLEPRRC